MQEWFQNRFAIEIRTIPLTFLPFDMEKANEKNLAYPFTIAELFSKVWLPILSWVLWYFFHESVC